MLNTKHFVIISSVGLLLVLGIGWLLFYLITRPHACDWPMWRYDANRSASSPQKLPAKLHLQWMREYPKFTQAWEDPLNQDLMQFDKVSEPVVHGKTLFIGSNANDKVVALNTETGEEKWAFYVDGPVRFPPVASNGKVYFVSDDGYLYCVDSNLGKLIWKFRGGPSNRKILGNERLISTWPARGGPVLKDGIIYFAAGIWPFMGVFIYALDAETGKVVWSNDSTGPIYMLQPHNSPSYAGVAPQGNFVLAGDKLLVPCGRSVPACFDRRTGEFLYYHLARYNKTGGAFVCALGDFFINYHRDYVTSIYELSTGHSVVPRFGKIPVMTEKTLFSMGNPITAYDFRNLKHIEDERLIIDKTKKEVKTVKDKKWVLEQLWQCNVDASGDLIKAGKRLYAGGKNVVSAIEIPGGRIAKLFGRKGPKVSWKTTIDGTAARIIAADNKLFVVTLEGSIYAFGGEAPPYPPRQRGGKIYTYTVEKSTITKKVSAKAESILKATGIREGYCLTYGLETGDLVEALARNSNLRIIAIDPDPVKVDNLRRRFDAMGLYGKRISVQVGDVFTFEAPPYLASLTVFENLEAAGYRVEQTDSLLYFFPKIYHSIRPYGGVACLPVSVNEISAVEQQIQESYLPKAKVRKVEHTANLLRGVKRAAGSIPKSENSASLLQEVEYAANLLKSEYLLLIRDGPLPGAADWTHQYGDIANTVKSDDELVKLPLGILWFGGSSNMDVLPRHGHGPPEQVIGGRLFIEGIDSFSARDVYTGRVLWKRNLTHLNTSGVYYDETYKNTPLDPAYNQVHIPGANARGANFVATLDKVYIAQKNSCLVLDAATGKTIEEIKLPPDPKTGQMPEWGYIGVYKDYLIAGAGFVHYLDFLDLDEIDATISGKQPFYNFDITSSKNLIIMNRLTGKVLWTRNSELGFRHNAIAVGDDKIFCIDMLPPSVSDALERRLGKYRFGTPKLMALNLQNGKIVWNTNENVFGTWLSYSKEHDILLQSGRQSRDMLRGEPTKGMVAYRGKNGTVLWSNNASQGGPYMLHGDTIITDQYSYSLLTGEQKMRIDPLTGEEKPWIFKRNYGCNYAIASEHLLTFRSAAAGFYDLMRDGGTGNFGGFKSGCTSNLVAANGVLNAPDYTRTCSCSYQNQTSLALVHTPDVEIWTTYFDEPRNVDIASSSSAIAFSDLEGKLIYVNNSLLKLLGYDYDTEILRKPFVELWQNREKTLEVIKALRDVGINSSSFLYDGTFSFRKRKSLEGRWIGELAAVKKDGSTLNVHLLASMITDKSGKPISMMFSFVKITDTAIAFFDLKGNLTYVNNSFLKLWGYDDDAEILGNPFVELWQMEEKALEVIATLRNKGEWIGELVAMKKDGSTLDIHLSASMVTDESGNLVSMMASFVDITERKRIEEKVNDIKSGLRNIRKINQLITGNVPIRTIGVNLGAPGDRKADNGTLWLEYPRVGGPSPDIPVSISPEKLLFSIDSKFQTDLDNQTISEELRQKFENKGFSLHQGATVLIEKKGSKWLITRNDMKTYIVRKEKDENSYHEVGDKLNIYRENFGRFCHHSSRIQVGEDLKPAPAWVVASGLKGVSSVTITLSGKSTEATTQAEIEEHIQERPYTVRLYFSEPDEIKPGQRVFDIAIQGRKVLENLDIIKDAGSLNCSVVKEFKGILVKDDLTVALTPSNNAKSSVTLICGIEVMAEGW
ncbi:PAS domain-containing protein [Candidatus Poribacteria bacterium]|nr:PAS domain-containing protein [Candidatus Poribacteria bacterium]